jgi:transcription antitermination factor NusG
MKMRQDTFSTGSEQQKAYWFAFYTRSKMERRVQNNLQLSNIECYTPVIKELRQWSDRMKWIEEPLFRNYVLAKVPVNRIYEILTIEGCVYVVSFEGKPSVIPDRQIHDLKVFLSNPSHPVHVSSERFEKGDLVKVINGALIGIQGEVVQIRGKRHIVLAIESLGSYLYTEIENESIIMVSDPVAGQPVKMMEESY